MQKSTWAAPTFEEIDLGIDSEARDDSDDTPRLLGRDTHVRLRSPERRVARPSLPPREER